MPPVSPPQRAPCPTPQTCPRAPDKPRLTNPFVSRCSSGARASAMFCPSRLLFLRPLTAFRVQNMELCALALCLPPRLMGLALGVSEGGTRSQ